MQSGSTQLRDWMDRRGFNQREAAEHLGFHEVHFSQILNEQRQPGLANAIKLHLHTGIPVESWALSELSDAGSAAPTTARKRRISKA